MAANCVLRLKELTQVKAGADLISYLMRRSQRLGRDTLEVLTQTQASCFRVPWFERRKSYLVMGAKTGRFRIRDSERRM